MTGSGFFSPVVRSAPRSRRRDDLPIEVLWSIGIAGVKRMNPSARTPNIQPSGCADPLVLCLGEAPGKDEDKVGRNFVGKAGQRLRSAIPEEYQDDVAYDNVVRTRPPNNRTPTKVEIECFRSAVTKSIIAMRPPSIIGLGRIPLIWALRGDGYKIHAARGRRFPLRFAVGDDCHDAWFYPCLHPSWILRTENSTFNKIPGSEWSEQFDHDIERVFRDLEDLPEPVVVSPEEAVKGIKEVRTQREAMGLLKKMGHRIGIDLETYPKRPFDKDAECLSIGFSDGITAFAVPYDLIRDGMIGILSDRRREFCIHNAAFDLEWLVHMHGWGILDPISRWHCSQQATYTLDCRIGALSLNFQCLQWFGLDLKAISPESARHRKDMRHYPMEKMLRYNALDAKWHRMLFDRLEEEIRIQGLDPVYRMQQNRVPAAVGAQIKGIPIDLDVNAELSKDLTGRIAEVDRKIQLSRDVKGYVRTRRSGFNPKSTQDCVRLFRDYLKRHDGQDGGRYSTGEEVLEKMKDLEIARLLLDYRHWSKLKTTYVDPFDPRVAKKTLVWPDGMLHPLFNTTFTDTGRLSSDSPNQQNWPKRKDKWVRRQIVAPEGWWLVSADFGQIEFRGIAMHSRDKAICKAIRDDYDVHMDWAEEVAREYPPKLKEYSSVPAAKRMKALRSEVKNQLVFPAFYLAGVKTISRYLRIPEDVVKRIFKKMWRRFDGVKSWQNEMLEFYRENRCVDALTGRRRYGPLSSSMIVNTPIQAMASDIVVESMASLAVKSRELDMPWIHPVWNIHDDLGFLIPDEEMDRAIEIIVNDMLTIRWDWINVPLTVEVEYGRNWHEMEEIGTFRSDKIEGV